MRCVVDAGFSLRRSNAIVSPAENERVRNWWVMAVFIGRLTGLEARRLPGSRVDGREAAYAAASSGSCDSVSCSSGLAFSARSSLRIEFTRISQMRSEEHTSEL